MTPDEQIAICSDFLSFTRYCSERGGREFFVNWHHRIIADTLMKVVSGEIKRLIINIPPRHSKSEMAVVSFIPWCLGLYPDSEFIYISYSKRVAAKHAYLARSLVNSEGYRELFGDVQLTNDSKAKDEWRTTGGGIVYASGSDGTITGYGAGKMRDGFGGAIIFDDPHKASEADSTVQRENVLEFYQSTVESRCNSPHTPIIIIMQRLHHEDLSGFLLGGGSGDEWHHLKIPAICDDGITPLWEFKHSIEDLNRMRANNAYHFSGQYQQEPTPREGSIIKSAWFKRYRVAPIEKTRVIQSWDTAYKDKQINDPSVCTTWLQAGSLYYLLESFVIRGDYPTVKRAVQSKFDQFRPQAVLIEDKASGQSLIQELRQTNVPVIAINPVGDKVTRLNSVSTMFEAGQVFLPESAAWSADYEHELLSFPLAAHDDQVDSTSQALEWLRGKSVVSLPSVGQSRKF
jgi:predicted phage terminase large subunit-like protein